MTRRTISTASAPRTGLPYSQAIAYGNMVFVSGQVPVDPTTGQPVGGDIKMQTRRVLDNISAILQSAGTSLEYALEATCFLADTADFAAFNEVYASYFPVDPPARTTVQAVLPGPEFRIEIRVVAGVPTGD